MRFISLFLLSFLLTLPAWAEGQGRRISLLRDAEIEETLRLYAAPLFKNAGLNPDAVKVHLINDPTLNAFVANGQNLFVNTGLLVRSENAGQIIGVFAHEVGHLSGGHLVRFNEQMSSFSVPMIASYVLGAAAAVGGSPEAGMAVIAGSSGLAERSILKYSRVQENSADQAAVTALDKLKMSSVGLLEMMRILEEDNLWRKKANPYLQTHPAITERIQFLEHHVAQSPYSSASSAVPLPQDFAVRHALMRGKIRGFLETPQVILQEQGEDVATLYAKAIAAYRLPDLPTGDAMIAKLAKQVPANPYFDELRGQMYLEAGQAKEAVVFYKKAYAAKPEQPLLALLLGKAMLSTNDNAETAKAATVYLQKATRLEEENGEGWHWLGIAYGRQGDEGLASLALAEEAYRARDTSSLRVYTERAAGQLAKNTPEYQRLQDLKKALADEEEFQYKK
jgi:predicted Zn-dependent protease